MGLYGNFYMCKYIGTYLVHLCVRTCISLCEKAGAYGSQKSTSGCLPWSHLLICENRFITELGVHHFDCTDSPATLWDQPVMAFPVPACFIVPNILHECWWSNIGILAFTASTLPSRAFSAALGLGLSSDERWLTTACISRFQVVFQLVCTYAQLHIHTDTHIDVIKIITGVYKIFKHTLN